MLQKIGTLFLSRPQLGAIEIKGFTGTGRRGGQRVGIILQFLFFSLVLLSFVLSCPLSSILSD